MSKELAVQQTRSDQHWLELKEQALIAQRSGLLPKAIDTPEKALVIAMAGRELGIGVMQSLTGLYVVNGLVGMKGNLMLRLIYERVPGAVIRVTTPPDKADHECVVEMSRPGAEVQTYRFTMNDAKKAGLLSKQPWQQYPSTMLRWAAIRTGARIVFADALAGCYMEDELPARTPIKEEGHEPVLVPSQPTLPIPEPSPPELVSANPVYLGDVEIHAGKYKGVKLKDRTAEEWLEYMGKVKASLSDANHVFTDQERKDATDIVETIDTYLATL